VADFEFDEDEKGKRDDRPRKPAPKREDEKPARSAKKNDDDDYDDDRGSRSRRRDDDDDDRDDYDDDDRPRSKRRGPAGPSPIDFLTFARTLPPAMVMIIFWLGAAGFLAFGIYYITEAKAYLQGILIAVIGASFWRLLCDRVVLATKTVEALDEIKKSLAGQQPAKKE
jgi:hypothetical protein